MAKQNNIVLIFTDNQQASTLGCYGNPEIHTPNLDRLSEAGLTFDNAFCPNAFCSPCRASLLTGLLPSQHGVHSWIDDRNMSEWPRGWHALAGMRTLPVLLKESGYATALVGKYHLGEPTSPAEGFDHWVTLEDGHVRSFYRNKIYDNGSTYEQPGHSVDFFTEKAKSFMEEQAGTEQPFFLYVPYPAPYGHWPATRDPEPCRHTERYADCRIDSVPRTGLSKAAVDGFMDMHAGTTGDLDFSMMMRAPNDLSTLRNYYAQVSMVDDGVGKLMVAVDTLGIADDTLFIFTTDHGLSVGQHGFWGHGGGCFPSNLHRAAHSIPLIVRQAGVTPEGRRSKLMVSNLDLFATILDHLEIPVPQDVDAALPSRSLLPILEDDENEIWGEDAVYSEQEETRVVRTQKWAYFKRFNCADTPEFGDELYDVEFDPMETENLCGSAEFEDIRRTLSQMIDDFFARHASPQADLWAGGIPIQNSIRPRYWKQAWGSSWQPVYAYERGGE